MAKQTRAGHRASFMRSQWIQHETSNQESTSTLDSLKSVLQKPPRDRSPHSIHSLMNFTSSIKFFKDLIHEQSPAAHFQCCQYMKYEHIPSNQVRYRQFVFRQGDTGSKFYVVLEGQCVVLAPVDKSKQEEEGYVEIAKCGPGDCFGELALVRNANRSASVMCIADSHFAVLNRDEFSRIIGKVKESILDAKVNFLSKFPFFKTRGKGDMQRISYYFKEQIYRRKQVVFSVGDPSSTLYFIREGEFQVLESLPTAKPSPILHSPRLLPRLIAFKLLTTNQLFGEEDIEKPHARREYAVVCYSSEGVLLAVSRHVSYMQDFVTRVGSEEAFEYLRRVNEQKMRFRERRLEIVTELERGQSTISRESSLSPLNHTTKLEKLPLKTLQSSRDNSRNDSLGVLLSSRTDWSPSNKLPFSLSNEIKTERIRPSWDQLLRLRRAEKERKFLPRSPAKSVINIHTHHKITRPMPILPLSPPAAPINIVTPLDSDRIREFEEELYT